MSATKVVGEVVFSGNLHPNPDGAEAALRKAGFAVVRFKPPPGVPGHEPGDELMEASKVRQPRCNLARRSTRSSSPTSATARPAARSPTTTSRSTTSALS